MRKMVALTLSLSVFGAAEAENWYSKGGAEKVEIVSTLDNTPQVSIFRRAATAAPAPLLVSLHTWSNSAEGQDSTSRLNWCRRMGWHFIQPDFRGPNQRPEAMGSDLAVQDVVDAVDYARRHAEVDPDRIYLVGASGGGHLALLLAGRHPGLWAGVSAWCPISDIKAWHEFAKARKLKYAGDIELGADGDPKVDGKAAAACAARSPVTYLAGAKSVNLDIATGIHDGHTGSVPVSHAIRAFNTVVPPAALAEPDIEFICRTRRVPDALCSEWTDPAYTRKIHFRKVSGNTRLTLFEGGHEEVEPASLSWLAAQRRHRPAVWTAAPGSIPGSTVEVGK